ncbi:alpha/beta fold hydrolase [Halosegnis sp.]|uniref:alpha/beta fold hydrolase n=1 Tax=Halosegnis sp. TaxID=2864959 RepID=UPI0035D47833
MTEYVRRYEQAVGALADRHGLDITSRHLQVDVGPVERVHTLVAGEGPPLLLLHGVGVGASSWLPLVAGLAERFTCYAVDRPGRGLSDPLDSTRVDIRPFNANLCAATLDALGIDSCPLVGNSFGGFQALAAALDRPALVDRLVLLGAPGGLSGAFPLSARLSGLPVVGERLVGLTEPDDIESARQLFGRLMVVDEASLSTELLAAYLAELQPPGRRKSLASVFQDSLGLSGVDSAYMLREELGDITQPTLFVWGSEDQYFPPSVGRAAAAEMPDAAIRELDGLGHAPWLEPDDRALAATRTFLS